MLATLVREPFHRPGWVYEEKYDGFRILAYKEGPRVTLLSRNQKNLTATFAAIAEAVGKLSARTLLLDGEVVAFDRHGVSRFQLLQNLGSEPKYAVFDCVYVNGHDLRKDPLSARRAELEQAIPRPGRIILSARLSDHGLKAYEAAKRKGLEGVVAKIASAPYREGRSKDWLKFKVRQEDEFVIVGYTAPHRSRLYFGALLLAAHDQGKLCYVGKVGTGFDRARLAELHRKFQPLVRAKAAVADPPRKPDVTWVAPRLVAQISYEELTGDRKLRQPVFLGLRDDKSARDVTVPEAR
jgi:bifunctional non-homologous end joining protein LigD